MSRSASEPLRALTEEETKDLQRVSRASSEARIRIHLSEEPNVVSYRQDTQEGEGWDGLPK